MSRLSNLARKACLSLSGEAADGLQAYADLLRHHNARLNLIARTDIEHVEERHVLHCLVLARRCFPDGVSVVDWGTGGGLPLIPLATLFPAVSFVGVDAVEKKTMAVRAMARTLGLKNVELWHGRAEQYREPHTHSVSRATAPLATLWSWHMRNAVAMKTGDAEWPGGLICLKGGDLSAETGALHAAAPGSKVVTEQVGLPSTYYADKHIVTVTTHA